MWSELFAFSVGSAGGVAFANKSKRWLFEYPEIPFAIGIMEGDSPFALRRPTAIENPVLTAASVTDIAASFVADPFLVVDGDRVLMFFEIMNAKRNKGEIGLAESRDGYHWEYRGVVLSTQWHLSYPYVFAWNDAYYMIPETYEANNVQLFRATQFPSQWESVATLLSGADYVDSSIVNFGNQWWLFTSLTSSEDLLVYYAPEPTGPWLPHARNPIVTRNKHIARPGGRMQVIDGKLYRVAQDDYARYGDAVWVFEVVELTATHYREQSLSKQPLLVGTGKLGWNAQGMHHFDVVKFKGQWLAAVDGYGRDRRLRGLGWRVPWSAK